MGLYKTVSSSDLIARSIHAGSLQCPRRVLRLSLAFLRHRWCRHKAQAAGYFGLQQYHEFGLSPGPSDWLESFPRGKAAGMWSSWRPVLLPQLPFSTGTMICPYCTTWRPLLGRIDDFRGMKRSARNDGNLFPCNVEFLKRLELSLHKKAKVWAVLPAFYLSSEWDFTHSGLHTLQHSSLHVMSCHVTPLHILPIIQAHIGAV
jgi:hypothetical protein